MARCGRYQQQARSRPHAFTLVEVVVSMVVMSILAAVTLPMLNAGVLTYSETRRAQRASGHMVYAIDRIVRMVRELGVLDDSGAIQITSADPARLSITDGSTVELVGTQLRVTAPDGTGSALCEGVTAFRLGYLDEQGAATTDLTLVHVVLITIERDGVTLSTRAFPRARITP